jgi:hypothetical protein
MHKAMQRQTSISQSVMRRGTLLGRLVADINKRTSVPNNALNAVIECEVNMYG